MRKRPPSGRTSSAARAPITHRRSLRLFIGLAVIVGIFFVSGAPERLANHFAERNIQMLDDEAAAKWLVWAQRFEPDNPRSLLLEARLARHAGNVETMGRILRRAVAAGAKREQIALEQTLALAQSGNLNESESEVNRLILSWPSETPEICSAYCNGLAAAGRIEESLIVIAAWEQDFPADPRPNFRRGMVFEHQQDFDRAAEQYTTALRKRQLFFPAWYSLGRVLKVQRQIDPALKAFKHCLRMKLPHAAEIGIAGCLREKGESDQARQLLRKVLAARPADIAASFQAVEFLPDGNIAARELGVLEATDGNFQQARPLLEAALRDWQGDIESRYAYALTLRGLGQTAAAADEFERVRIAREALAMTPALVDKLKKNPHDSSVRLQLGETHWKYESLRKGMFWVQSVLAYEPENVKARELLKQMQSQSQPPIELVKAPLRNGASSSDAEDQKRNLQ